MKFLNRVKNLFGVLMQPLEPLQNRKQTFVDRVKQNPSIFLDLVNRAKEKIQEKLVTVKQKIVDIKKSISQITLQINRATRKISMLMNRIKSLQEQLKKVQDKIKELEKQPGQEKNVEILKMKEKEILAKLRELNLQIQMEQNRIKQLEERKKQLITEKNALELQQDKYQTRLNELDSQKLSFEQAMGITPKRTQPLQKILQQQMKENRKFRQEEPTQTSNGNFAFRATYDGNGSFNMQKVESEKNLPTYGTLYNGRNKFIASRLTKAENNGFTTTPSRENNNEHGGKDNPSR